MARSNAEPNITLYNLRDLRAATQAEVAQGLHDLAAERGKQIAVTANAVSRWERGIAHPSALYRQLLAEYYGVTVEELGLARQRLAPLRSSAHLAGPPVDLLDLDEGDPQDSFVIESQEQWLTERRATSGRQADLGRLAARLYPEDIRVDDIGILARPEWLPPEPVDLADITISYDASASAPLVDGTGDAVRGVLPLWSADRRFPRYSYAIRDLAQPTLFENRPCWRITDAKFADGAGHLTFGDMNYFDAIDVSEALSHETLVAHLINSGQLAPPSWRGLRLRKEVGDPLDLTRHASIMSINTLTIRRDKHSASIVLHSRSAANVATSGGVIGVMPAGVFQPSTVRRADHSADFDLWRNIMREYSEEFLGNPEHAGDGEPADYSQEPFAALDQARQNGKLRLYAFGFAVGALDMWGALETVAVIDSDAFDEIFRNAVIVNTEGTVVQIGKEAPTTLIPFTEATLQQVYSTGRLGAETRYTLSRSWQHRDHILD